MEEKYIKCENCDGTGRIEILGECDNPASMCCGGCSSYSECDECNGTAEVDNPKYHEL